MSGAEKNSAYYWVVLGGFLFVTFVGSNPFSPPNYYAQANDGLNRLFLIVLFLASLPLLWVNRGNLWTCIRSNPLLLTLVAVCCLSVLWSQYPSITVKRAGVLGLTTISVLALAASCRNLRDLHTALFVTTTIVVICNILYTLVFPQYGIELSPLGVRGFYAQKNSAGIIALMAVVIAGTWVAGTVTVVGRLTGIIGLFVCLVFLVATLSKTSIALALISLTLFYTFVAAEKFGEVISRTALSLTLVIITSLILFLLFIDFDVTSIVEATLGDVTFTGRDELWAYVYKMASDRPLSGYGYGAFWDVGDLNDPLDRLEPGTWLGDIGKGVINQAHNGYLELWLQMGLPVMALAVVAAVATLCAAVRAALARPLSPQSGAAFGMVAVMMLVYLLHNIMEATLLIRGQPLFSFTLLLTFVSSHAIAQRANERLGDPE